MQAEREEGTHDLSFSLQDMVVERVFSTRLVLQVDTGAHVPCPRPPSWR